MKLLSVTIPCYNSEAYMAKCIESLLKAGERVEIIIIDDGSKDNTGAIADEYASKYPTMIKVVHQENGGHGEGINQGIAHATGKYFKVVDSDDWLSDDLTTVLDRLEAEEANGGVDLLISNYVFTHDDSSLDNTVGYGNGFDDGKVITWQQSRNLKIDQYITIHSATFRTQAVRDSGLVCPKHCFYEDNLYVYTVLPFCKKVLYMNVDLYHYYIGREGQSVQRDVFARRYAQQVKASTLLFCAHHLDDVKKINKKLYKYMLHEATMLVALASVAARVNGTKEAEEVRKQMWKDIIAYDKKYGKKLRWLSYCFWVNLPGAFGRWLANVLYDIGRGVMKFN